MTTTERVNKHRQAQADEIQQLRSALLAALALWPTDSRAAVMLHTVYADVIARAYEAEKEKKS